MVSSTGKISVLADASVVSTYICTGTILLVAFVYIAGIFFISERVHSCTVYCCICIYVYLQRYVFRAMYICMVITYSKGKNQPDKITNPARGQLAEQGKRIIPCPRLRLRIRSCETGSAVPSRVSLLISILQPESRANLRDSSRVQRRRPFVIGTHYVL